MANLSFILKFTAFSEVYLEPSRTSMMKIFVKIAESRSPLLQKKLHHKLIEWAPLNRPCFYKHYSNLVSLKYIISF